MASINNNSSAAKSYPKKAHPLSPLKDQQRDFYLDNQKKTTRLYSAGVEKKRVK